MTSPVGYACDLRSCVPVMRCDGCGASKPMRRKDARTVSSPEGWVDDGPRDLCPVCAAARDLNAAKPADSAGQRDPGASREAS